MMVMVIMASQLGGSRGGCLTRKLRPAWPRFLRMRLSNLLPISEGGSKGTEDYFNTSLRKYSKG